MDYCPDGGTITFAPYIKSIKYENHYIENDNVITFTVDRDITIDGTYYSKNGMLCGVELSYYFFRVERGAKLTLRGIFSNNFNMLTTESYIINRGDLVIEDCRFGYFHNLYYGAAINTDGGTVKIKNSTLDSCEAMYGGAIAVRGGAKVDMLNCSVTDCNSRTGSIHNIYGEVNIVNSEIVFGDVPERYEQNGGSLTANRVTRVVNSILYFRVGNPMMPSYTDYSAAGDAELYGCLFDSIDDNVKADERCEAQGNILDVIYTSPYFIEGRGFYNDEINLHTMVNLKPGIRKRGYIVRAENGKVVYSDGENTYQTGIDAAFDGDDYTHDILGTERSRAYGCCCDLTKVGIIRQIGDVNYDGVINIRDVTAIRRHLAEYELFDEEQLELADVNFDGTVNIDDATALQKEIAEYNVF